MEALIRFLFDNLLLVIIVIGILSSLFGRTGRQGGGGRMPDFGGGPGGWQVPRRETPGGPHRSGETTVRAETARQSEVSRRPEMSRQPEGPRSPEVPRQSEVLRRPDHTDAGGGSAAYPREPMDDRHHDARGRGAWVNPQPARASDAPLSTASPPSRAAASAPSASAHSYPAAASSAPDLAAARAAEASRIAPALQVQQRAVQPAAGQDELRKAVLWAEILGPPRALKPHGRRRFGR